MVFHLLNILGGSALVVFVNCHVLSNGWPQENKVVKRTTTFQHTAHAQFILQIVFAMSRDCVHTRLFNQFLLQYSELSSIPSYE